jgi:DHA2 family multidrug resistance protein
MATSAAGYLAQHGDSAFSHLQALGQLAAQIYQQAAVITYSETFYVLGVAMLLCIPLALVLRSSPPRAAAPAAQH